MTGGRGSGRLTNLALLALVALALATGTWSFAVGRAPATTWATTAHASAGLALVLLVPWKTVVARRGLARHAHRGRRAGAVLGGLLAVSVVAGVVQEVAGFGTLLGVAPLQLHVLTALLAVPLLVVHTVTHPQRPRAADLSRRAALRGVLLALGALGATGLTRAAGATPPAQRPTGSTDLGSGDPARMPVTQWFSDRVPAADDRERPLLVRGVRVALPAVLDEVDAVLDCTGGWYAAQRWGGVRLDRLLGPLPATARSVDVVSVTGYRRRFPVEQASALLVTTTVAGRPLSPGHGAPRRLVVPGRRGFWWVKWVAAVEVSDEPPWLQPPFPLQ